MKGERARAIACSELQKRVPEMPEDQKIELAKQVAVACHYDQELVIKRVAEMFPTPEPDRPKEDSAT